MHKFLRAIGFSTYEKKPDVKKLISSLIKKSDVIKKVQIDDVTNICEVRCDVAPGVGVAIVGEHDSRGRFHQEYYYPYIISNEKTSDADCSIQRHAEKETYAGLLDEYKVGISLIFYIQNSLDYIDRKVNKISTNVESANLSALSVSGKILLPVMKTENQKERERVALKDRNSLIEAAKNGDEDAMETLTIEDIDTYSKISRRMIKEDIYSIIDSFFMPCGIECDQYSIIGEIVDFELKKNCITKEEVYDFRLDCNDLIFHVGINKKDLIGEPAIGRRFKGQIWMQGIINFNS